MLEGGEKNTEEKQQVQNKTQNKTQIRHHLSDREFKLNVINKLRALMKKVDNVEKQMGNVSREMKTLKTKSERNARNEKYCNKVKMP